MSEQNYSAVDAFRRWQGSDLALHLNKARRNYTRHRLGGLPSGMEYRSEPRVSRFSKWRTVVFGRVTWAVFARAYWAIYQPGRSPAFYGSVIVSRDEADESGPALFEIAEYTRRVREYDVPLDGIAEYVRVIRDDNSLPHTIEVPESIAQKRGVYLQTILVERAKLPCGYLHHRLIPVTFSKGSGFVSAVHQRYWDDDFRASWSQGDPPLTEDQLREYRANFPEIVP